MAMNVQFLKGQSSKFKAEGFSPVSTTFYFLEDTLELYLGSKLLSNEVTAAQFAALEARVKALEDAKFQDQINAINETLKSIATSETVEAIDERLQAVEEWKDGLPAYVTEEVYNAHLTTQSQKDAAQDEAINSKQAKLSEAQLAAVNSGVTADKISKYDAFLGDITPDAAQGIIDTIVEINNYVDTHTEAFTALSERVTKVENGDTVVAKANADKDGNEFSATYAKKADLGDLAGKNEADLGLDKYMTTEAHNTFVSENAALQSGITATKVGEYDTVKSTLTENDTVAKANSAVQPAAISDMATKTEVEATYLKIADKYDDTAVVGRVKALEGRFEGTNAQVADIVKAVNKLADNSESTEIVLTNITNNTKGNAEAIANIETQLTWGSF